MRREEDKIVCDGMIIWLTIAWQVQGQVGGRIWLISKKVMPVKVSVILIVYFLFLFLLVSFSVQHEVFIGKLKPFIECYVVT